MREHVLLFCLLGLVLIAAIMLLIAPEEVTWALSLVDERTSPDAASAAALSGSRRISASAPTTTTTSTTGKIGSPIWVRTSHWPLARHCTANSGKANSMGLAGSARCHAAAAGRDFKRDACPYR